MTEEFINRLFAALVGKERHVEAHKISPDGESVPAIWDWTPSSDGEITKEVRDFMKKELPEEWEKYLGYVFDKVSDILPKSDSYAIDIAWLETKTLTAQLSITNLAKFIVDNWKGMFMEECPEAQQCTMERCKYPDISCEGNGITRVIVKKGMEKVVKLIEKEGKE